MNSNALRDSGLGVVVYSPAVIAVGRVFCRAWPVCDDNLHPIFLLTWLMIAVRLDYERGNRAKVLEQLGEIEW